LTSLDLWHSFVDSFAQLHDGMHRNWIVERGMYPDVEQNSHVNALLASLSESQRRVLAEMMVEARRGGVHDALVILNDRLALNDATYSEHGVAMEFQPYGTTLYQDYVARQAGEPWPESGDA